MDPIEEAFFGRHEADPRLLLHFELLQRRESGYDVDAFTARAEAVCAEPAADPRACLALLEEVERAGVRHPGWPYAEPDAPADPPGPSPGPGLSGAELADRIHGGWLGRCAGCTLGKPLENGFVWTPARIRTYLEHAGAYPLAGYVPVADPLPEGCALHWTWPESTRGNVHGCPRDDDLDYTVLGLHIIETHGRSFTAADVGDEWLRHLPFLQTYTAERVAYRNLVAGLTPPATARHRNPYREWIGAMIRADIFGYLSPADPEGAARLAAVDASVSHTANGVYAAMWAAALVAAAFGACGDPRRALAAARQVIPAGSRLAEALDGVTALHERGAGWEEAVAVIHARHGHYNWVHAVGNACLVAAGLLWGEGDFTRTIGLTVQGGWDTDSNGATAGSVAGVLTGASGIPGHWTEPLDDRLRSALAGFGDSRISELARRTVVLARGGGAA